jgi:hypothetical protein
MRAVEGRPGTIEGSVAVDLDPFSLLVRLCTTAPQSIEMEKVDDFSSPHTLVGSLHVAEPRVLKSPRTSIIDFVRNEGY